ncbi:hypothetical protein JKP88DRAFT_338240 [Tribonema minus]|uniref:Uncharacterized protein n=1 Tax=Tribonema minus TaxID=303371 RepID=A0A836C8N0_9STRA|nr:hypothetical protein JKP88DRAFT_338240 [Tribonema minus]
MSDGSVSYLRRGKDSFQQHLAGSYCERDLRDTTPHHALLVLPWNTCEVEGVATHTLKRFRSASPPAQRPALVPCTTSPSSHDMGSLRGRPRQRSFSDELAPEDEAEELLPGVFGMLTTRERHLLDIFLTHVNSFLPLVTEDILALPLLHEISGGDAPLGAAALDWQRAHARTALVWGCIANGAVMENDGAVMEYSRRSQSFLKECFDAPCTEAVSAHLAVSLFWGQFGENEKRKRYAQFAEMVMQEIEDVPPDLVSVLNYLKARPNIITQFASYWRAAIMCASDCAGADSSSAAAAGDPFSPHGHHRHAPRGGVPDPHAAAAAADDPHAPRRQVLDTLAFCLAALWRARTCSLVAGRPCAAVATLGPVAVIVAARPAAAAHALPWHAAHVAAAALHQRGHAAQYAQLRAALLPFQGKLPFTRASCPLPALPDDAAALDPRAWPPLCTRGAACRSVPCRLLARVWAAPASDDSDSDSSVPALQLPLKRQQSQQHGGAATPPAAAAAAAQWPLDALFGGGSVPSVAAAAACDSPGLSPTSTRSLTSGDDGGGGAAAGLWSSSSSSERYAQNSLESPSAAEFGAAAAAPSPAAAAASRLQRPPSPLPQRVAVSAAQQRAQYELCEAAALKRPAQRQRTLYLPFMGADI